MFSQVTYFYHINSFHVQFKCCESFLQMLNKHLTSDLSELTLVSYVVSYYKVLHITTKFVMIESTVNATKLYQHFGHFAGDTILYSNSFCFSLF